MSETNKPAGAAQRHFEPIGMEIFSNRLQTITEEMGNNLIRSAFSTNIKERRDCSVGLFDGRGRLVAQASHIPLHLGSLKGGVEAVLRRFAVDTMQPGDAFICNDPYLAGGTHLPDVSIVTPVFCDGRVCFLTANIAHHSDFGGSVPGSISGGARSIFEEGLRLPAMRIVRAGALDEDLLHMVANNTRQPEERILDLNVQIATNDRGAVAVRQLVRQMGLERVEAMVEDVLEYTARRLRNRVRELKNGSYSFTSHLDEDGSGTGNPVALSVTVTVDGERLGIDFAGSGAQARGAMNVPLSALQATVYYAIKALLDPQLMPNHGMFEAIDITAPEGTITNPRFPAAVGARSITCQKIAGAIFGAFRGLLPKEKVYASGNDLLPRGGGRRFGRGLEHRRHGRGARARDQQLQPAGGSAGERIPAANRGLRTGAGFGRRRAAARRPGHRARSDGAAGRHRVHGALGQPPVRSGRGVRRARRRQGAADPEPRRQGCQGTAFQGLQPGAQGGRFGAHGNAGRRGLRRAAGAFDRAAGARPARRQGLARRGRTRLRRGPHRAGPGPFTRRTESSFPHPRFLIRNPFSWSRPSCE